MMYILSLSLSNNLTKIFRTLCYPTNSEVDTEKYRHDARKYNLILIFDHIDFFSYLNEKLINNKMQLTHRAGEHLRIVCCYSVVKANQILQG